MVFELKYTLEAAQQYDTLSKNKNLVKRFKAVRKALRFLQDNPAHPGLQTHKIESLVGPHNSVVFEAYAENKTPGAYRIFWCYYYPPKKENKTVRGRGAQPTKSPLRDTEKVATITVIAITPHP